MTDDTSQTQDPAGGDALAQLEALLNKAKTSRGQAGDASLAGGTGVPAPGGVDGVPAPDPEAAAQAAAAAAKEVEAVAMQAQIDESEAIRMQALEEQKAAMSQLADTPQYQARVQQEEKVKEEHAAESAVHDGHEIIQITETKL